LRSLAVLKLHQQTRLDVMPCSLESIHEVENKEVWMTSWVINCHASRVRDIGKRQQVDEGCHD
jgi:hypothetical protein